MKSLYSNGLATLQALPDGEAADEPRAQRKRRHFVSLTDRQWLAVQATMRGRAEPYDRGGDPRLCLEAALSVMVGNCYWSQLPVDMFGDWKIAYNRTQRWIECGVWASLACDQALEASWRPLIVAYLERRAGRKAARGRSHARADR